MFDDPSFDGARHQTNDVMDYFRRHGPFEPHRLPLDEMEYTTMPSVAKRLADRWSDIPTPVGEAAETDSDVEAWVPRHGGWAKLDVEC